MALHLGGEKLKINLNGTAFIIAVPSTLESSRLMTKDGFMLTDYNGLYFTLKESE